MTLFVTDMTEPSNNNDPSKAETPPAEPNESAESNGAPEAADAAPQADTAEAPDEMEKLRTERDDYYNRYLRAVADLDNYRRRVQREKDELRQFAITDLVESLLPVFEHLGLAVTSAKQASDSKAIVTGVSMVLEQFRGALAGVGLAEINPEAGADFDPHQHESLSHAPSDTIPAEKILQVVRTGFSLRGRLLRPASVVLSGGPPSAAEADTAESSS